MFIIALFPVFCAIVGWLVFKIFTILMQQTFYKKRTDISKMIAQLITEQDVAGKIEHSLSEKSFTKLEPMIAGQITQFIEEKLPKKLPVLSMFSGDKLMVQAKDVVMEELKDSLPAIIKQYSAEELSNEVIAKKISENISQLPSSEWESLVNKVSNPFLGKIQIVGTILGFVLGILFILFIFLYYFIFLESSPK